jgi:hypothetical protein
MRTAAPVAAAGRAFRTGPARLIGAAVAGALVIGLVASPLAARSPDDVRRDADQLVVTGIEQFRQGRSDETFRVWQEALRLYGSLGDRQRQESCSRISGWRPGGWAVTRPPATTSPGASRSLASEVTERSSGTSSRNWPRPTGRWATPPGTRRL